MRRPPELPFLCTFLCVCWFLQIRCSICTLSPTSFSLLSLFVLGPSIYPVLVIWTKGPYSPPDPPWAIHFLVQPGARPHIDFGLSSRPLTSWPHRSPGSGSRWDVRESPDPSSSRIRPIVLMRRGLLQGSLTESCPVWWQLFLLQIMNSTRSNHHAEPSWLFLCPHP